jgi:IS1 family transposase
LLPAEKGEVVEMDEIWSFIGSKDRLCWLWLALCRRTRQIIAFALGDRSSQTAQVLWGRIPKAYRHRRTYTDLYQAYWSALPERTHWPVGKEEGKTNHIERFNNTLRQRLSRFVRRTLSFSKSLEMHTACLRLFLHRYNEQQARIYLANLQEQLK